MFRAPSARQAERMAYANFMESMVAIATLPVNTNESSTQAAEPLRLAMQEYENELNSIKRSAINPTNSSNGVRSPV